VTEGGGPHGLLIRRWISDGQFAFYRAHAPGPVRRGSRLVGWQLLLRGRPASTQADLVSMSFLFCRAR
jgi:hypothetical protein